MPSPPRKPRPNSPRGKYDRERAKWNAHHAKFEVRDDPFFHVMKLQQISGGKIPGGSIAALCKKWDYSRRDAFLAELGRLSNEQPLAYFVWAGVARTSGQSLDAFLKAHPDIAEKLPPRLTRKEMIRIAQRNVAEVYDKK